MVHGFVVWCIVVYFGALWCYCIAYRCLLWSILVRCGVVCCNVALRDGLRCSVVQVNVGLCILVQCVVV